MITPPDDLVAWFFKLIVSGIMGLFWWRARETSKKISEHSEDIAQLKVSCVTQDTVREIFREENRVTNSNIEELKQLVRNNNQQMTELSIKIAMEEGYRRAERERQ